MRGTTFRREPHEKNLAVSALASEAAHLLTPLELCFWKEARTRWPKLHWRRYHPVTIKIHERPSTWYAPFYCTDRKLIVVIQDREEFPYRIYGQNRDLYTRHGYTVMDFSEDFSAPWNQSVWDAMMVMVDRAVQQRQAA